MIEHLETRASATSVSLIGTVYLDFSALPDPYNFEIRLPYELDTARGWAPSLSALSIENGELHYRHHFGGPIPLDMRGFEQTDYAYVKSGMRVEGQVFHAGDSDRDGDVDFTDFLRLSSNFGKAEDAVWADGDWTLDGAVDFADFLALSANFGD